MIFPSAVAINGLRIFSTHSSIAPSSVHAFFWQWYSQPVSKVKILLRQSYHSVYLWISTAEATLCHLHMFTARVTHLVSSVVVFTPIMSKVCLEWEVKKMFFFLICLTLFFPNLHDIKCIWCCLCRRTLRFMSTHPAPEALCQCDTNLIPFLTWFT